MRSDWLNMHVDGLYPECDCLINRKIMTEVVVYGTRCKRSTVNFMKENTETYKGLHRSFAFLKLFMKQLVIRKLGVLRLEFSCYDHLV